MPLPAALPAPRYGGIERAVAAISPEQLPSPTGAASPLLIAMIGASAAIFACNLYYAQPLLGTIAAELGIAQPVAGSVASASQFGYGLGLFLLVPLSDIVENKRLVLACCLLTVVSIVGVATARSAGAFLCFAMMIGIFSSGAQVLLPYLSHLIPPARSGRIIGAVLAGILTSVMFARPFALFVAAAFGWRTVYWISAATSMLLGLGLWRMMPPRRPSHSVAYHKAISTMFALFTAEARVRRRTLYQATLFATFTMFWAVIPIVLAERFGLGKAAIGLFALVGAGGVLAAPLAGRLADRGATASGTAMASLLLPAAFLLSIWSLHLALPIALAAAAVVIDGSIQLTQVLSRVTVFEVAPEIRGRINALYMTIVYVCGAAGSMLGVTIYYNWGWSAVAILGAMAGLAVFCGVLAEKPVPFRKRAVDTKGEM